jgi:uncharacterized protein (TIGR00255 family)
MIRSMTGYGKGRGGEGAHAVLVEVRSVNARGRELRFRLPPELAALEAGLREQAQQAIARGRVDVALSWERGAAPTAAHVVDDEAVASYVAEWRRLQREHDTDEAPQLAVILRLPGALVPPVAVELDLAAIEESCGVALAAALERHRAEREREGGRLAEDLRARAELIEQWTDEIAALAEGHPERLAELIRERVAALAAAVDVDPGRIAQEVAVAAQRADVTEELVRLRAHLARWSSLLAPQAEEVGRTLEFIVQEVRREVTTLSAKLSHPDVDARVLSIKGELEKIREQAANLE